MERCVKMILLTVCLVVPASGRRGGGVLQGDGVLVCPTSWTIGRVVKLTLTINEARFESQCVFTDNQPFFKMSSRNGINTKTKCTVSDITAAGACSGSFTPGSRGCGCTSKEGGYYVLEYNFIAHPDYNGWWSAGIVCRDKYRNEVLSFETQNCDKMGHSSASNTRNDAKIGTLVFGILTFGASNTANNVKVAALVIGILTFGL